MNYGSTLIVGINKKKYGFYEKHIFKNNLEILSATKSGHTSIGTILFKKPKYTFKVKLKN